MSWTKQEVQQMLEFERQGMSHQEVADAMGKTRESVRKKYGRVKPLDDIEREVLADSKTVNMNQDGTQQATVLMRLKHEPNKDARTMLELTGYDPDKFELISSQYKVYEQHSTNDGTVPQYSITVKVAPKSSVSVEELCGIINQTIVKTPLKRTSGTSNGKLLVIPLYDLHFGVQTYDGFASYLKQIIEQINSQRYERIVIEIGGDLLHSDYIKTTRTVSGTQLDHADMIEAWRDAAAVVSNVITAAVKSSNAVELYAVGGNHDFDMQWAFVEMIRSRFVMTVAVHNNGDYRATYNFHNVGIMMAHGDTAKRKLSALFAAEFPHTWSSSTWREIHYGHFHTEITNDDNGAIVRQFGTPKPSDGYEIKNGYTMGQKTLKLLEYSHNGLRAEYTLLKGE